MEDRIIRRAEVQVMAGLTERQIRNLEADGKFPKRFPLFTGSKAIGWSAAEVQKWIADRKASRAKAQPDGPPLPQAEAGAR